MRPSEITDLRKGLKLTKIKFARILGVSDISVASWEKGVHPATGWDILVLNRLLDFWLDFPDGRSFIHNALEDSLIYPFTPKANQSIVGCQFGAKFLLQALFGKSRPTIKLETKSIVAGDQAVEIATIRTAYGLTQAEFGKALGISGQSVCNWEKSKFKPSRWDLAILATLFDCFLDAEKKRQVVSKALRESMMREFFPPPESDLYEKQYGSMILLDAIF